VTIIGDGKGDPVNLAGDKLANMDNLKKIAEEQTSPEPIKSSRQQLSKKLFEYVSSI